MWWYLFRSQCHFVISCLTLDLHLPKQDIYFTTLDTFLKVHVIDFPTLTTARAKQKNTNETSRRTSTTINIAHVLYFVYNIFSTTNNSFYTISNDLIDACNLNRYISYIELPVL